MGGDFPMGVTPNPPPTSSTSPTGTTPPTRTTPPTGTATATIASYVVILDGGITVDNEDIDKDVEFKAPGAIGSVPPAGSGAASSGAAASVLAFRVRTDNEDSPAFLQLTLNNKRLLGDGGQEYKGSQRSWHEIVPAGILKESGNKLTLEKTRGVGKITIRDIVLFYRAALRT
jgi:hypothetical protein